MATLTTAAITCRPSPQNLCASGVHSCVDRRRLIIYNETVVVVIIMSLIMSLIIAHCCTALIHSVSHCCCQVIWYPMHGRAQQLSWLLHARSPIHVVAYPDPMHSFTGHIIVTSYLRGRVEHYHKNVDGRMGTGTGLSIYAYGLGSLVPSPYSIPTSVNGNSDWVWVRDCFPCGKCV